MDLSDPNNPWILTDNYSQAKIVDGRITPDPSGLTLYKEPNEYTNLFSNYSNSLLGMYLFLAGT